MIVVVDRFIFWCMVLLNADFMFRRKLLKWWLIWCKFLSRFRKDSWWKASVHARSSRLKKTWNRCTAIKWNSISINVSAHRNRSDSVCRRYHCKTLNKYVPLHFPAFKTVDVSETRVRVKISGLTNSTNTSPINVIPSVSVPHSGHLIARTELCQLQRCTGR